ncbi:hypothetical protein AALP_AAs61355U000100 [Arabis alpina]|uniref:Uncharacterized protein n=1 Tax=Arabis alpina TaxID=50452 RepID=A0A087G039_ARAAL|nr:hypothetical protein AALP_AAs61355U000100 [Arabis alpina]
MTLFVPEVSLVECFPLLIHNHLREFAPSINIVIERDEFR